MGSGKEVKLKKSRKGTGDGSGATKPRHNDAAHSAALRKERMQLKKDAKVEADRHCRKYVKLLKDKLLQPSRKHYGGLGYAKESVFVDISDPEYNAKFTHIWNEHITGFSGKSFKKRKTEADKNMLWRHRLQQKSAGTPTARVETLISQMTAPKKRNKGTKAVPGVTAQALGVTSSTPSQRPADRKAHGEAKRLHASGASSATGNAARPAAAKSRQLPVTGDAAALQAQAIAAYRALKARKAGK